MKKQLLEGKPSHVDIFQPCMNSGLGMSKDQQGINIWTNENI